MKEQPVYVDHPFNMKKLDNIYIKVSHLPQKIV